MKISLITEAAASTQLKNLITYLECDEDTREAMEDDNHGNVDNGNEETSQKEREERETSEEEKMEGEGEGEAGGDTKEGEGEQQNDGDAMETVQDLFRLSAVNAYGSQEVKKIEDEPGKFYTITSESSINIHPKHVLLYPQHAPPPYVHNYLLLLCVCQCQISLSFGNGRHACGWL